MSYQVIARKYRPQKFGDIVGQEHITRTLQNAILAKRLHHAYLLTGIRGIGKTTLARIFAKILNCEKMAANPLPEPCNECESCKNITAGSSIDVQEIDGASNTGVDDVREIRERVKYLPSNGKYKIYIIDEVHMLSTAAFNALLKTLEEPPAHVIFIFATTEVHKIPATILSRCQRYDFRRITMPKIVETLKAIAKTEDVETDDECLNVIATEAEGSMRDAESLFDQAIAFAGKKLEYSHLKNLLGFLDQRQIDATVKAIGTRDTKAALAIVDELFQSGENLNRFVTALLDRFHDLLVKKASENIGEHTLEEYQQWFNMLYRGAEDISRTKFQKIVLDVLITNMTKIQPVRSVEEILEKIEKLSKGEVAAREVRPQVMAAAVSKAEISSSAVSGGSWPSFLDWLKLNKPQVASFLELSSGGMIVDSNVIVKFAGKSFASERLMEADRKAFLEKLACDFFKKPMKVEVQFDTETARVSPMESKMQKFEENKTRERGLKEEALKHDAVRDATNIFGAEIKDIKVR